MIEDFELAETKTKAVTQVLRSLDTGPSTLLVADGASQDALRAARNIPRLSMKPSRTLSAIDLLSYRTVIMTVEAVRNAEALFGGRFVRKASANGSADDNGVESEAELAGVEE